METVFYSTPKILRHERLKSYYIRQQTSDAPLLTNKLGWAQRSESSCFKNMAFVELHANIGGALEPGQGFVAVRLQIEDIHLNNIFNYR